MCVLAGAFALALAPSVRAADRKMVSFAWEWHRNGAKELMALQPQVAAAGYDGIGVDLRFPHREGTNTVWWGTSRGIMEQPDWDWDELAVELDDFRKLTGLDGFRECFVSGYRVPAKRFAWTDDASWGRISRKMTQLARYAKLAGFAGICIDHEDYTLQRQFEHLPDDPPMPEVFGLPRIITSADDVRWLYKAVDNFHNGLTFCAGSLSAGAGNDVEAMAREFAHRVHFVHLRSCDVLEDGNFIEAPHTAGRAHLVELIRIFEKEGRNLPMRVDHGKDILGDAEGGYNPGYGFYGRMWALGQVTGMMAAVRDEMRQE